MLKTKQASKGSVTEVRTGGGQLPRYLVGSLVVDAGHEDAASTSDGGASLDVVGVDKKQLGPNEDHRVESLWRC